MADGNGPLAPSRRSAVRCAIYTRKSTEKGLEREFNTLDAQRGAAEAFIRMVYRVDRLRRSQLDFARIMELLDKHGASFVSVTQQFNTTRSLGRLTLNILLSFAHFEREMIAERTKDRISSARRMGRWMGGIRMPGHDISDRGRALVG